MNFRQSSLDIIRAGQAYSGAYIASPTFSQYGYSWLRDGAWIAYGMDSAGQHASARIFHQWAARTLIAYREKVDQLLSKLKSGEQPQESDYLPTRFALDGTLGSDEWPDFQLDGYGAWLWGLAQHCTDVDAALWTEVRPAVEMLVRYLAALWQSPNYDCWEEHRHQLHTATLAALYGGLAAIRKLDASVVPQDLPDIIQNYVLATCVAADGHFVKYVGSEAVDASLLWVAVPYHLVAVDDPRFLATLAKIERDLYRPGGGVYRYLADTYYGGGEWLLLAAWLGWIYVELNRIEEAERLILWVQAQVKPNGEMPEQVSDHLLDASYYPQWMEKWGTPASPLLWSHAMYLVLENRLQEVTAS